MTDISNKTPPTGKEPNALGPTSNFLTDTPSSVKSEDILYNDFFQENGNGEITLGAKKERSGLEVLVSVLEYTTIFVVIVGTLSALHVFIRSSENASFLENYSFLCPYLNYDIAGLPPGEAGCKNVGTIQKEYTDKKQALEGNIVEALNEYIPIKVSSSILDASPERRFILNTFANKPHVNNVLEAFEKVKSNSQKSNLQSGGEKNIKCTGVTVTEGNILSTQCTIYGGPIGNSNTNGQIGSARIEALDFIEKISDTTKSSLTLYNYPTSMSIEVIDDKGGQTTGFATRTTIPINVGYVPLIEKP